MPAYADSIVTPATPESGPTVNQDAQNRKVFSPPQTPEVDVVISGMSGRFPESVSVQDFSKNLFEGIDMITEDDRRWMPGIHGLPKRSGKLADLQSFDAPFFNVSPRQADTMDPQLRLLLEVTYEALFDAGVHPNDIRGKKIGVYVGVSLSESEDYHCADPETINGYGLTGTCRAMFANRLSYALDLKGPSFAIDTACSSSLVAFTNAWSAIKSGEIDSAIVAGSNVTLKPQISMQFNALNMLSVDGCCKSFDASGNGYVRSEAVAAVYLQRSSDARRVYAHAVQARMNTDGFKSKGITFPSGEVQKSLIQEVYQQSGITPSSVSYVEAHGTGTKAGDPQEVNAIADVFCQDRNEPLLLGSVKSNMGHAEAASGLCSVIKVLLAMQKRKIPGNLHFKDPNPEIPSLADGRIKVVSSNTPWKGGYAAINSFGFGGANAHLLLKSFDAPLRSYIPEEPISNNFLTHKDIPRLVISSGRTEAGVEFLLNQVSQSKNKHVAALLDKISDTSPTQHPFRGFSIVRKDEQIDDIVAKVADCPSSRAPLWLVFTGMGSQWTGCGRELMKIPIFASTILRCHMALKPFKLDIVDIITRLDPDPMTSSTNSFTAIAAIQVGLVELLRSIGLTEFDGVLGHSVGELGCAFADGTLTAEQTVLTAYWRGRAVEEAKLPPGAMAAVGLSGEKTQLYCGNGSVVVACYNSKDSVTISGPTEEVEAIKSKLVSEDIFCRGVNSGGVAFHHSSLKKAAPRLLTELKKFIQNPQRRSSRWISTSVPESKWDSDLAAVASPEYFVNNLVSPVLFAQGLAKIPDGATLVEVAPHALLQAVLRRAVKEPTLVPLIRKDAKEPLSHLLQGLGRLYNSGVKLNLSPLYSSDARFPVPLDTPGIASLIKWDHELEWDVATFTGSPPTSEFKLQIDLGSTDYSYVGGHIIDGRVLFPATGYLMLVWRALSKLLGTQWESTNVTFEDITLHQATVFTASNPVVTFTVRILQSKGEFEVLSGETLAVTGKVHAEVKDTSERRALLNMIHNSRKKRKSSDELLPLEKNEVYKELKLRGYEYDGLFKGIENAFVDGSQSQIAWHSNWVSFLDTMLQASLLGSNSRGLCLPTRIRKFVIEPAVFQASLEQTIDVNKNGISLVQVSNNRNLNVTVCPGVEIYGLKATLAPRRAIQDEPLLETYKYIPRFIHENSKISNLISEFDALKLIVDLFIENNSSLKLKILQILSKERNTMENEVELALPHDIAKIIGTHPQLSLDYSLIGKDIPVDEREKLQESDINIQNVVDESAVEKMNLFVVSEGSEISQTFIDKISDKAFILARGSASVKNSYQVHGFVEVSSVSKYQLSLLKKKKTNSTHTKLNIDSHGYTWLEKLKTKFFDGKDEIIWLVSKGEPLSGTLGMFKCLRREPGGERLRCFIDTNATTNLSDALWNSLLESDLAVNIRSDQTIGTMRYLDLPQLPVTQSQHAYLNVLTRGDLASLTWLRGAAPEPENGDKSILSTVHYAPLNFRDIMLASGKLPPDALPGGLANKDCVLGLEFAGISEDGSRVMGLVPAGGLATRIRSDPLLTWKVPSTWTLREASTVPVVYATAYYALVVRGQLKRGESILIHAGSGGVGQAAISIALSRNCRVFTTVSSEKKRLYLKERFPQLTDDSFANSRDASFEYDILDRTQGYGVDIVLNSLAGELLQASVRCLKEHGRFLEIGKADLANNSALGMSVFLKNVTFHGILLDALFTGMKVERKRLQELLYEGMIIGEVVPLPATCYNWHAAEEAFRFMASGKHIGKVVLEMTTQNGKTTEAPPSSVPSVYRFWPRNNLVYIITGGLGGLGLEICDWLISRGAKDIVLTSRRGVSTGYQALCLRRWQSSGAEVRILTQDASTVEGAESLLRQASVNRAVGGIFHLAMVLEDSILENQSIERFQRVCQVKAEGAIALDQASRLLCPDLHVWVTFSSVVSGRGNAGQSNYGWANNVSEKVAQKRVKDGLPGVAIQWGGIGDVGVLASTLGNVDVGGTSPQSVRSVLSCMDHLIGSGDAVVSSICLSSRKSNKDSKSGRSILASIANVLGIRDISKVPTKISLGDLGLDSLMGVEIKQILEREADVVMSAEGIRDLSLTDIAELENSGQRAEPAQESNLPTAREGEVRSESHFSWIDYPLLPTETLCPLNERQDSTLAPLFILSPMQGTCQVLAEVSQHVEREVIGIQYTAECPSDAVSDIANFIIQKIEARQPHGDIYLAGYSFGANIAIEILHQLEKKGRKVSSLILLDGSHSYVLNVIRLLYDSKLKISSENLSEPESLKLAHQKEIEALVLYGSQLCSLDLITLKKELNQMSSWDDKATHLALQVLETVGKQRTETLKLDKKQIVESTRLFYRRMAAVVEHDKPNYKLRTKTLLLRAGQNTHASQLAHDYELSKVIQDKIQVEVIPGTHESIIVGENARQIGAHINKFTS